jgi:hypothetical protein
MTIREYAATTARAFMTLEIAWASVNCGAANVTRMQTEKLLGDLPAWNRRSTARRTIPWTAGPDPSCATEQSETGRGMFLDRRA